MEDLTLLDFETYYIATVMNTVILVQGQKNQWNRIEFRNRLTFYGQQIFNKGIKNVREEGKFFPTIGSGTTG